MADVLSGELGVLDDLFLSIMRSREGGHKHQQTRSSELAGNKGHRLWKDQLAHIGIHHNALWQKFGNSGSTSFNVLCSSGICIGSTKLEYVWIHKPYLTPYLIWTIMRVYVVFSFRSLSRHSSLNEKSRSSKTRFLVSFIRRFICRRITIWSDHIILIIVLLLLWVALPITVKR